MEGNAMTAIGTREKEGMNIPFFLLLFYLVVEYARPVFLAPVRPALILQIILVPYLFVNREKVKQVLKEKYFKLYLVLLLLMSLHVFIAVNNYWAYMQFQGMITYLLFGISFCVFLDSVDKLNAFFTFFIFIMALCSIDRIFHLGLVGEVGSMGDENDFALAANVALPIGFFLARAETGWRKWFFWCACGLLVLANISCASRGGFLGMAAVGAVCWVYSKHKIKALLAVAVLAVIAWNFAAPDFKGEIRDIGIDSADRDTGKDRIELWKVAWKAFLDNPVVGVGQGNMPIMIEKYQYDKFGESYWKRGLWGRAIHSLYFTLLPELGLVGIILFGLMLRVLLQKNKILREMCKEVNPPGKFDKIESLNTALLVSIFAFLVSGAFLSVLYYPEFWNMSALLLALFSTCSASTSRYHETSFRSDVEYDFQNPA